MYPVPAPAIDCDDVSSEPRPEIQSSNDVSRVTAKATATRQPTRPGLTLVETCGFRDAPAEVPGEEAEGLSPPEETAASESDGSPADDADKIAARILALHAAAKLETASARAPRLVGTDAAGDDGFEMPGVLLRPAPRGVASGLEPKPVPQPPRTATVAGRARSRRRDRSAPGFLGLAASTLVVVIGAAGGLYAAGLLPPLGQGDGTRIVSTQSIAAEPTIESLIDADQVSSDADALPTSAQIARAKDRLRNEITRAGLAATGTDDGKIQARLAAASPVDTQAFSGGEANVRPVAGDRIARDLRSSVEEPVAPAVEPPAPVQPASSGASVAAEPSASGYPNTGTISASVNLRQTDNKNGDILAVIPKGAEVAYADCGTWWCGVRYDGQAGYVGSSFLQR